MTCSSCESGYSITEGKCVLNCDVSDCAVCVTNPKTCKTCEDGFYVTSPTCTRCVASLPHCNICSDESSCVDCDEMYTPIDGKCYALC